MSLLSRASLCLTLVIASACNSEMTSDQPVDMSAAEPAPDPPLPRVAVFNEIHYAPLDKTVREEFVELVSVSDAALDLSGWRLTGGIQFTFPAGTQLAPGGYVVVAQDPAVVATRFGYSGALGPFTGRLANSGDTVILRDDLGRRRDELAYVRGFPFPTTGGDSGRSIERINLAPGLDGTRGGAWRLAAATGPGTTPGARSSVYDENPPPLIDEVRHSPVTPRSGQPITVTANITDSDGVADVTLEYQVVEPGAYVRLTDATYGQGWTAVAMKDDGVAPDGRAGDGTFTAILDGAVAKHRRLVRYRITARDAKSRAVRVPYADDPQPNFALFIYDGVPAWRGASQPGTTPVRDFGADVMSRLPVYHLIAVESDVLKSQYDGAYESAHFYGTMVQGDTVYDHIEFENRGEYSTYVSGKNKWRFHFQRGHEIQASDDFGQPYRARWRTMNLSACATPWVPPNRGMACLDESVAFRLYALAGTVSPHMNYLHFRVIDEAAEQSATDQYRGDLWGLYATIEQTDGGFLDERGLPDGNLYKVENGQGDKRNQGELPPTTTADYDAFRTGFNSAQPITWWRANLDLQAYYAMRATDRIVNNMDLRDGWNHCIYHNPVSNLFTPMPWDLDMLYMPVTHWSGVLNLQNSILQHAELYTEYRNRARELQDLLFTADELGALVDEQAAFVGRAAVGGTLSFAQLDESMWNYHPRTTSAHRGAFYKTPLSATFRGGTVNRTLVSPDHAGMVRWLKDFTLTGYGAMQLATEAADAQIPDRPTLTYVGAAGFPLDGIRFRTGAFSDPQGAGTFGAMQWRVAEVTPAAVVPDLKTPRRFEIDAVWESPILTTYADTISVPGERLRVGAVHRARVRMRDTTGRWSRWSAPVEFTVGAPAAPIPHQLALRVSEIHYHPAGDLHEEFIELVNTGSAPLDLSAVSFTQGIRFRFADSTVKSLAPGERVVLVENLDDFRARYGAQIAVAGQYQDRLSNGGERIVLTYGQNVTLQDLTFNDAWYPRTDGGGRSLEVVDARAPADRFSTAAGWAESADRGGTPGR
ncbi:MAG: lamin tail domain-containing protein [Polyangia bacterium]